MLKTENILSKKYLALIFLAVIGAALFASTINAPFHLDDFGNIIENPGVRIKDISMSSLKKAAFNDMPMIRPVSYITFAFNYYISGSDTTSYHIVNVLIHIINAFLIYLIILKMLDYDSVDNVGRERISISAFFTALIWLVTPVNSQAVIYIVQRMALLMTLFFLLSFYFYIARRKGAHPFFLVLSIICFIFTMLSKENGVTLPLAIIIYEIIFERKCDIKNLTKRDKVVFVILFLLFISSFFAFKELIITALKEGYKSRSFTMGERLMTQPRVLIYYLSLMVLPLPGRFSITYDIVKSTSLISPATTLLAICALAVLLVAAVIRARRSPYFSFAILWFFVTISVESSIIPLEMVFEHRMYLPCIFIFFIAVDFCVKRLYGISKNVLLAVLIGITVLLSAATYIRGNVWRSEITLWKDVISKYPDDGRAYYTLGTAYLRQKMYAEAERYTLIALEDNDPYGYAISSVYNHLGNIKYGFGKIQEALQNYEKSFELDSENVETCRNLGRAYFSLKDYTSSIKYFSKAIDLDPENASAYNGLGAVNGAMGNDDKALIYFEKALYYDPQNAFAMKNIQMVKSKINQLK